MHEPVRGRRHTVNEQIALLETDEQMTLLESKVRSLLPRTRAPQTSPHRTPRRSALLSISCARVCRR